MSDFIIWNSYDFAPYSPVRPMGPHQLGHHLAKFGYNIKIIDFCSQLSLKQIINLTERYITKDTIGIGVCNTFWNSQQDSNFDEPIWACKARGMLELKYPKLKWILGGSRTSYSHTKFNWIKFVGFAEDSMLKFLDEHTNKNLKRDPFNIQFNDHRYLDNCSIRKDEVLSIELSRGCVFKCTFCRFPLIGKKKNTYLRKYELVEQELLYNYERFGTTRYYLMDDTVNESEEKIIALAEIANRLPFKLEWVGYLRLDLLASRPHTISLLKQSGLRNAWFGVESFNKKASKIVNKGWHGEHAQEFLLQLQEEWKNEVVWQLSFIVGLTGETPDDVDKTHQWCIDNKMHSWFWNPLSITTSPNFPWKSYFDLNYKDFGYSFPQAAKEYYWVNDYWNYDMAVQKSNQLSDDTDLHAKPGPWTTGELATVGYSFDDCMYKYKHELNWDELKNKTTTIVDEYFKDQIA